MWVLLRVIYTERFVQGVKNDSFFSDFGTGFKNCFVFSGFWVPGLKTISRFFGFRVSDPKTVSSFFGFRYCIRKRFQDILFSGTGSKNDFDFLDFRL